MTVSLTGTVDNTETLSIVNGSNITYNPGTGVVSYDYGGTTGVQQIGTVLTTANGTAGKSLTISFNAVSSSTADVLATNTPPSADAQANAVQSLMRQIFFSTSHSATAGTLSTQFAVTQNNGLSTVGQSGAADTIAVSVSAAPNNAPAGTNDTVSTSANTSYTFGAADFGFTDPNETPANSLLAVEITTLPGAGSLMDNGVAVTAGQFIAVADITGGLLTFTPATNASGSPYTSFTFQVQDNGGTANGGVDTDPSPKTMTINVSSVVIVNHAPTGSNGTVSTNEDTAYTFATTDFGFSDPNDSTPNTLLAIKITTLPATGVLTDNGVTVTAGQSVGVADISGGLLKFTPAANSNGAPDDSFTFQVQDNGGTANGGVDLDPTPKTLTINVVSVNDAPVGTSTTVTTNEDSPYTFATSDFGFTDPNDSPANSLLAVKITTVPSVGTLADNGTAVTAGQLVAVADIAGGLLTFIPAANKNGTPYTTFTFQVQDDGGTANSGVNLDPNPKTLTVNVMSVNDAPAGTNKTVSMSHDTSYMFAASDFGFTDPNDTPANNLLAVTITTLPTAGTLADNGKRCDRRSVDLVADITGGLLIFNRPQEPLARLRRDVHVPGSG